MPDISRLPAAQTEQWDWQLAAACRGSTVRGFFQPDDEPSRSKARVAREAAAKQLCQRCTVQDTCLQFALDTHEAYGVWGGYNPAEREALLSDPARSRRSRSVCP